MSHQARLDFLWDNILTADPKTVEAIIQNMSTASHMATTRKRATFILWAHVGQKVRYATLPYEVKRIYTEEDNQDIQTHSLNKI